MSDQSATATLPAVFLKGKQVATSVLEIIPLHTTEKFQVIAYEENATELKLAVVHPEQLKQGFFDAIKEVGTKIGKKVELYKTDPASFQYLLHIYQSQVADQKPAPKRASGHKKVPVVKGSSSSSTWDEAPKPPLFELGTLVAYNYLRRIPYEFAKKERLLCVDYLRPSTYWFVTDNTNNTRLQKAVQYISQTNKITIHMMVVEPESFDELLTYYQAVSTQERESPQTTAAEERARQQEEEEAIERKLAELNRPLVEEARNTKLAKDVIVPGIQAQIITSEEEKKGLAGFIQKVAQNFAAQETDKKMEDVTPFTPPPTNEAAQPTPVILPPNVAVAPTPAPTPPGLPPLAAPAPPRAEAEAPAAPTVTPQSITTKSHTPGGEENEDIGKLLEKQVTTLDELTAIIRSGMVPRIVAATVSYAIHEKASDIHIESYEDEVRVRYRVDGQLLDIVKLPPDIHNPMVSRIKILSRLRLDENRVPQDGRFDVNFDENTQVDVRISVMPTVHGEKVVMRILDKSRGITSLEKLGIEGIAYERLTQSIQKPYGICLATGPTGSGKSTSLYAILSRIATPNVNVVTLEDPIEYEIKGVNQSQIRPKIGYTFAEGLRSILRQDPNIIMVGEIRDGETATMATQSALTGHLVLSTLHTNDAAGAIPRLTNMGIEPFLITSSLNVAMAQRLVRRICQNCIQEVSMPQGIRSQFEHDIQEIADLNPLDARRIKYPIKFYQGAGCSKCGGKGYDGRLGIYEVLVMTDEIADLTIARASANKILEQSRREGMLTLYQDGLLKAINGITTMDEVLRESSNK